MNKELLTLDALNKFWSNTPRDPHEWEEYWTMIYETFTKESPNV